MRPDHRVDHLGNAQSGAIAAHHVLAVARHGDPIGNREYFFKPMRNVQHRGAASAQLPQDLEQSFRLALVQRRIGLVEDQQSRFFEQHPRELDELLLSNR